MLARRAASALDRATIARPFAACLVAVGSDLETVDAAIGLAASPSGGEAAAPSHPPLAGRGSTGGLWNVPCRGSQPDAAQQFALVRFFSIGSSLGEQLGSSSSSSSSSRDRSGLSKAQLQVAAQRLMRLSRDRLTHPHVSRNTEESVQQRMLLLLRLGFSQAAIERAMQRQGGGPFIAEQHIGETVALLRRWGFSQQQLDKLLAGSNTFTRTAADIQAVLAWLQREFGLQPSEVAKACSRNPTLLDYQQETLQANWSAFVAEFQPTTGAMKKLRATLRLGDAKFLTLTCSTLRQKVAHLRELFGLDSTPRYIGHLAGFFCSDFDRTVQPRFAFLQQLTGLPAARLAPYVVQHPALVQYAEATLQRNFDAVLTAMGGVDGLLLVRRRPDILLAAEGRVAVNLRSLQQLGATEESARKVLLLNPRLALVNMQSDATFATLQLRLALWQQAYGLLSAGDAAVKCASLLHRSLRTVAPRVVFYQQQRPGQPLPTTSRFTVGDEAFCRERGFDPAQFAAFKAAWLASEEGRAVCRHEKA